MSVGTRPPDEILRADVSLLERIAARDEAAVGELYDRHHRLLFSLIARIMHNRAEAEEVLQEVFLSVWTRADTYNPALGAPLAWLVRLARNRAIDRLRTLTVRARAVDALEAPPVPDNPEQVAARSQTQGRVRTALDALPPEQRDLLEQAFFRGLTHSELAAANKLPLGTVKTRLRSGMQTLRQQLGVAAVQ